MEWVGPGNQIVISYSEPALIVLNIRSRESGEYLEVLDTDDYPTIRGCCTERFPPSDMASLQTEQGVEGVVVRLADSGQRIKMKTAWYVSFHHAMGIGAKCKTLYEAVLKESSDDLKALYQINDNYLKRIT